MPEEGLLTSEAPVWTDGIAEENRGGVKDFTSVDALAKGHGALYAKMGSQVKMPDEATSDEERSAFYQKLGRPEKADGYSRPELPEGEQFDEAFLTEMAAVAHAEGVSDKQFRGFIDRYMAYQAKSAEAKVASENAEADATQKQLHEEWAGNYDKNLEISKRALRELIPADMKDAFVELIAEKNLDNNFLFIKAFHFVGSKMMDDKLVKGDPPKVEPGYTPQYPNSPEMYANGESEDAVKGRAWHTARGHNYQRS